MKRLRQPQPFENKQKDETKQTGINKRMNETKQAGINKQTNETRQTAINKQTNETKQKNEYKQMSKNKQDDFMTPVKSTPTSAVFCMFAIALLLISLCAPATAESLIPVMPSDTLDYYAGYGEPELSASIRGSNEFNKGESAVVQVSLVNKGVLEGVYYREYVSTPTLPLTSYYYDTGDTDPSTGFPIYSSVEAINISDFAGYTGASMLSNAHLQLASVEMMLESYRVNAVSLNIQFQCDSPYVEIETGKDYAFLGSLYSGSSNMVFVPVRISPNAPAGEYLLNATIDYSYPSNAKMFKVANMTDGFTTFLYSDSYIQEYQTRQVQLQIPFYIASGPVFEVTNVEGTLDAGRTKTISVTYTNVGDETAYQSESKIDMMYPLSSSSNKGLLGDVAPGESVTIHYPVKSHSSAMPKIYGINSNVRYYNADDKLQITPGLKINVELEERYSILTFKNILIGTFLLVVLSLGLDYYKSRKKKKDEDSYISVSRSSNARKDIKIINFDRTQLQSSSTSNDSISNSNNSISSNSISNNSISK